MTIRTVSQSIDSLDWRERCKNEGNVIVEIGFGGVGEGGNNRSLSLLVVAENAVR